MDNSSTRKSSTYGSEALDKIVNKLKGTKDPRRRYEYVIWLGKKLPAMDTKKQTIDNKVNGCISEVYVLGELIEGRINWQGYSDALITKGLLSLLVEGLNNLTPEEVIAVDQTFISETGLQSSLTPSRANGFLNILLKMQTQARKMNSEKALMSS